MLQASVAFLTNKARNQPSRSNNNITYKLFPLCTPRNRLAAVFEQPEHEFPYTLNKSLLTKAGIDVDSKVRLISHSLFHGTPVTPRQGHKVTGED